MTQSTVNLICTECKREFVKTKADVQRRRFKARGDNFFCSKSCSASYGNKKTPRGTKFQVGNSYGKVPTPFRYYLTMIRNRIKEGKFGSTDITSDFLVELWNQQKGKCAITGIDMIVQQHNTGCRPESASLDRIDSSIGYERTNVRFMCLSLNLAKNKFTNDQFMSFMQKIGNKNALVSEC